MTNSVLGIIGGSGVYDIEMDRMRTGLLLSVAALLAMANWASAEDSVQGCYEGANSQAAMTACAGQDFQQADDNMNAAYRDLVARVARKRGNLDLFEASQRAWLEFRNAECKFMTSGLDAGSVLPMAVAQCKANVTRQRLKDLEYYLNCFEGDILCPTWEEQ